MFNVEFLCSLWTRFFFCGFFCKSGKQSPKVLPGEMNMYGSGMCVLASTKTFYQVYWSCLQKEIYLMILWCSYQAGAWSSTWWGIFQCIQCQVSWMQSSMGLLWALFTLQLFYCREPRPPSTARRVTFAHLGSTIVDLLHGVTFWKKLVSVKFVAICWAAEGNT